MFANCFWFIYEQGGGKEKKRKEKKIGVPGFPLELKNRVKSSDILNIFPIHSVLPPRQVLGMRTCGSKLIEDFETLPCLWHMQLTEYKDGFSGLGVACWPLVPKFAGSNPAEFVGFLGRKSPEPSFGGEVKPSVPCCRFAACKRSLNLRGSRNLGKITTGRLSRPQFHLSLLGSLASLQTEAPGG